MSFRQFPAVADNGDTYVIIEFKGEPSQDGKDHDPPRYELADGRHLVRRGQQFTTTGGELTLSAA
jgi:hypothetical protein